MTGTQTLLAALMALGIAAILHGQERQTALLQQIATNTTQPIHTETTIAKVDEGVCSTLVNALGKSGNGKKGNGK